MKRKEAISRIQRALSVPNRLQGLVLIDEESANMAIEALQDRPHGEWIHREHCQVDEDAYEIATCSHCKAEITLEYPNDNFCPNCGARMKGGGDK